jgi:hypothetical protein
MYVTLKIYIPKTKIKGCRINLQKCPVARTQKKGLKQSFLTDSGKAQSSEMVRVNRKKAYLFYSKALLGSRVVASTTERSFPIPRCQAGNPHCVLPSRLS